MIDSLRKEIPKKSNTDTMKAMLTNLLAFEYSYLDLDSGLRIAEQGLKLADITNHDGSRAALYNTIGTIYHDQANYKKAVESFALGRKYAEQARNSNMQAIIFANLGNTYQAIGDFENSKLYLFQSLEIFKEEKAEHRYAPAYLNIGSLFNAHGDLDSALYYFQEALKYPVKKKGITANIYASMGNLLLQQNKLKEAEEYYVKAVDISRELNSEYYETNYALELAEVYIKTKRYEDARVILEKGLKFAKKDKLLIAETQANYGLYRLYREKGNYEKALEFHEEYFKLKDSIFSAEKDKSTRELEKQYQTEKKQTEIEKLSAENAAKESENKRKDQQLFFAVIAVVLVLLALGFAVFAFINKRKANKQLQELNREVLLQKDELQDKNKSITDSIHYAQRIQNVLLTSNDYIKESLKNFFILNKPKDIVSGDFYWAIRQDNYFYFQLADCTGHGVPGAFMSLLGISFLNEIVLERKIREPDAILNQLRAEIIKVFTDKSNQSQMNDGMDCVLCRFDLNSGMLHYAAANNSIVIIRNNELIQLSGDKMPVGKSPKDHELFTLNTFQLQKDDTLYMFTDGFPDQFGGPQGKKFKAKNVKQLLLTINHATMEEQAVLLNAHFENWRGNHEQIDDVCVTGFRF